MTQASDHRWLQTLVGLGALLLALVIGVGAISIPAAAGYGGVGPNFLAWLVAGGLALCGLLIVREARTGGFRQMDPPAGAAHGHWPAFAWVSAGLLSNAALITTIGFVFSCTLCYVLAVQGLRRAAGQPAARPRTVVTDAITGAAISAPVYWMFTQFLAINLPGITGTGWL